MCQLNATFLGFVYVVDSDNNRICVFTQQGKFVRTIGRSGCQDGEFQKPRKICITRDDKLIVTDSDNNRVQVRR